MSSLNSTSSSSSSTPQPDPKVAEENIKLLAILRTMFEVIQGHDPATLSKPSDDDVKKRLNALGDPNATNEKDKNLGTQVENMGPECLEEWAYLSAVAHKNILFHKLLALIVPYKHDYTNLTYVLAFIYDGKPPVEVFRGTYVSKPQKGGTLVGSVGEATVTLGSSLTRVLFTLAHYAYQIFGDIDQTILVQFKTILGFEQIQSYLQKALPSSSSASTVNSEQELAVAAISSSSDSSSEQTAMDMAQNMIEFPANNFWGAYCVSSMNIFINKMLSTFTLTTNSLENSMHQAILAIPQEETMIEKWKKWKSTTHNDEEADFDDINLELITDSQFREERKQWFKEYQTNFQNQLHDLAQKTKHTLVAMKGSKNSSLQLASTPEIILWLMVFILGLKKLTDVLKGPKKKKRVFEEATVVSSSSTSNLNKEVATNTLPTASSILDSFTKKLKQVLDSNATDTQQLMTTSEGKDGAPKTLSHEFLDMDNETWPKILTQIKDHWEIAADDFENKENAYDFFCDLYIAFRKVEKYRTGSYKVWANFFAKPTSTDTTTTDPNLRPSAFQQFGILFNQAKEQAGKNPNSEWAKIIQDISDKNAFDQIYEKSIDDLTFYYNNNGLKTPSNFTAAYVSVAAVLATEWPSSGASSETSPSTTTKWLMPLLELDSDSLKTFPGKNRVHPFFFYFAPTSDISNEIKQKNATLFPSNKTLPPPQPLLPAQEQKTGPTPSSPVPSTPTNQPSSSKTAKEKKFTRKVYNSLIENRIIKNLMKPREKPAYVAQPKPANQTQEPANQTQEPDNTMGRNFSTAFNFGEKKKKGGKTTRRQRKGSSSQHRRQQALEGGERSSRRHRNAIDNRQRRHSRRRPRYNDEVA